jgi:hypothetical protein
MAQNVLACLHVVKNEDLPPPLRAPEPPPRAVVEDVPAEPAPEDVPPQPRTAEEKPSQPYLRQG